MKDFLLGLAWGLLLGLFLIWLFNRNDNDPTPDDGARQDVPRERGLGDDEYLEVLRKAAGQ